MNKITSVFMRGEIRFLQREVAAALLEGYALAARRFSVSVASLRRFLEQRRIGA
jgi:hypothetical protein